MSFHVISFIFLKWRDACTCKLEQSSLTTMTKNWVEVWKSWNVERNLPKKRAKWTWRVDDRNSRRLIVGERIIMKNWDRFYCSNCNEWYNVNAHEIQRPFYAIRVFGREELQSVANSLSLSHSLIDATYSSKTTDPWTCRHCWHRFVPDHIQNYTNSSAGSQKTSSRRSTILRPQTWTIDRV